VLCNHEQNFLGKVGTLEDSPLVRFSFPARTQSLTTFMGLGTVPLFMSRSAVTHELFDLVIELRPSSTSAGLEEHIKRE